MPISWLSPWPSNSFTLMLVGVLSTTCGTMLVMVNEARGGEPKAGSDTWGLAL